MTLDYDALDPGIRDVVRLLREHGFDTRNSGRRDGRHDHLPGPGGISRSAGMTEGAPERQKPRRSGASVRI